MEFYIDTKGDFTQQENEQQPEEESSVFIPFLSTNSTISPRNKKHQKQEIEQDYLDNIANQGYEFQLLSGLASLYYSEDTDQDHQYECGYLDDILPSDSETIHSDIFNDSETSENGHLINEIINQRKNMGLPNINIDYNSKNQQRKRAKESRKNKRNGLRNEAQDRIERAEGLKSLSKSAVIKFMTRENEIIHEFASSKSGPESRILSHTPASLRKLVFELAGYYNVTTKCRGKGKDKISVIFRTQQTRIPPDYKSLVAKVTDNISNLRAHPSWNGSGKKPIIKSSINSNDASKPRVGDVVGFKAEALSESNIGHKMLMKLGWKPGESLGADGSGITEPITATIRAKRSGLGN